MSLRDAMNEASQPEQEKVTVEVAKLGGDPDQFDVVIGTTIREFKSANGIGDVTLINLSNTTVLSDNDVIDEDLFNENGEILLGISTSKQNG